MYTGKYTVHCITSILAKGEKEQSHDQQAVLGNAITCTFQADILRVLQLNNFIKSSIYIIQAENFKVFIVLMRLQKKNNNILITTFHYVLDANSDSEA